MEKILWLASWYPSKIHCFNGDFIQRHARAVSIYREVHLIHVIKDKDGVVTQNVYIERKSSGNLSEVIVYYKPLHFGIKFLDRVLSLTKYIRVYKQVIKSFIRENGPPGIVHVHVAMWSGVLARWLKGKYGINYFITEHWSGYNKLLPDNLFQKDFIFRGQVKKVMKDALMLMPVSGQLGSLIAKFYPVEFEVVSNVVDTRIFNFLMRKGGGKFRFIHVSTMDENKNVAAILRAFSDLLLTKAGCELVLVGPCREDLRSITKHHWPNGTVQWRGEVRYEDVAREMQHASALVMFSKYETQSCVILEALCCGLPVVATAVGGIPEIVHEDNGILVDSGDEQGLLNAMIRIIETYQEYNQPEISRKAVSVYNYQAVGEKISKLYDYLPVRVIKQHPE